LDERKQVDSVEVQRRVDQYYLPYHQAVQQILDNLKKKFEKVLLWDCHSIRQLVLTIQSEKFPDLILGSADSTSASPALIETTIKNFESASYSFRHNFPFKGGFITRNFGKPSENQHALQLEMTKILYMDDTETQYHAERASSVQKLLKQTLRDLTTQLIN
jgi:N-formylglutamate deformylase